MVATIQLRGIVDIPKSHLKKRIKRRYGNDIAYLAPAFCKKCSCILSEDPNELIVQQLLFDVAELSSRGARRELFEIRQSTKINNVNTVHFTTVKNKWDKNMRKIWASIFQDILILKKEGSLGSWQATTTEAMKRTEDFATQPIDLARMRSGKPIKDNYIQAETIVGDLTIDKGNAEKL